MDADAVGVVGKRHGTRIARFGKRAETHFLDAGGRFDVRHKRIAEAVEAHLRVLGRNRGKQSAALREAHPGAVAVTHRKVIPVCRILRQLEFNRGVFGHNGDNRRLHVRKRKTPIAGVQSLRGVWEHLHTAFSAGLKRERLHLLLVGGEAGELNPAIGGLGAAAHRKAGERGAFRDACGQVRGKTLLRKEPVAVVEGVDEDRKRLAVRVGELGEERDVRGGVADVVGMVAPRPEAHRVEPMRHRHGRGRREADDGVGSRHAVGEVQHAVAEEDALGRGVERARGGRCTARPAVGRDERQQHRPIIGHAVGPVEFIRTRSRHNGKYDGFAGLEVALKRRLAAVARLAVRPAFRQLAVVRLLSRIHNPEPSALLALHLHAHDLAALHLGGDKKAPLRTQVLELRIRARPVGEHLHESVVALDEHRLHKLHRADLLYAVDAVVDVEVLLHNG